jgi:hypothetical protein
MKFVMIDNNGFPAAFYDEVIHGAIDEETMIPQEAVPITDEQWQECLKNNGGRKINIVQDEAVLSVYKLPDEDIIEREKALKISSLNSSLTIAINSGFQSDALGSLHNYDSEGFNREWIQGATKSNKNRPITCDDLLGNPDSKQPRIHTKPQAEKVLDDAMDTLFLHKEKFRSLRDQVLAIGNEADPIAEYGLNPGATTEEIHAARIAAINAIVW